MGEKNACIKKVVEKIPRGKENRQSSLPPVVYEGEG